MANSRRFGLPIAQWQDGPRERGNGLAKAYQKTIGRLLGYCRDVGATVSEVSVRSYLDWYRERVAVATSLNETKILRIALPVVFPGESWRWMFGLGVLRQPNKALPARQRPVLPFSFLTVVPENWPEETRAVMEISGASGSGMGRFEAILHRDLPKLSSRRRMGIRCAYGQYLFHRRHHGEDDAITQEGVASFASKLEDRGLRPRSIATYIYNLAVLVKAAKLPGDWDWLDMDAADLVRRSKDCPKLKNARNLPHPLDIWRLGLSLVEQARKLGPSTIAAAAAYRDGVLLMLAVSQPLRLGNLAGIKIGSTLVIEDGHAVRLDIPGNEMKSRRPLAVHLWPELQPVLDEYIAEWRPILGRGHGGSELWLGARAARVHPAMTVRGVYKVICARTAAAFGKHINPHLLRDVAATAMIEADPSRPRLASDLLQHHSPDIIREYTEQASSVTACRAMRTAVTAARAAAQARVLGGAG